MDHSRWTAIGAMCRGWVSRMAPHDQTLLQGALREILNEIAILGVKDTLRLSLEQRAMTGHPAANGTPEYLGVAWEVVGYEHDWI